MIFENVTYESILQEALDRVPDDVDKREGSVIYDAIAPCCFELYKLYVAMSGGFDQCYAATATGTALDYIVEERGLTRNPATYSRIHGKFDPAEIVTLGQRFSVPNGITFVITASTDDAAVMELTCETAGAAGNISSGTLIPATTITGLKSAVIADLFSPAEDEEDDIDLRERYYNQVDAAAFAGNISDYKTKTDAIDGVGGTHVIPVWTGGGTVKLIIIASDNTAPTAELVKKVQEVIDPESTGTGRGLAPIGHKVTVVGAESYTCNISVKIEWAAGWDFTSAKSQIEDAINRYLSEIMVDWENTDKLVIRYLAIEASILDCEAVTDVALMTLNEGTANITLSEFQVPMLGTLTEVTN